MLKRRTRSRKDLAPWTLMVYMVADDHDKDDAVFTNKHITKELDQIGAALARNPSAQVAAQADRRGEKITRHFVAGGRLIPQTIDQRPPGVESIRDFITFGIRKHPAEHYLFLFWGHGFGPAGLRYSRFIRPEELRKALRLGFGTLKPPIDIVAFMSCQMNTIELAYEFSHWPLLPFTKVANHIVASQGSVEPTESFPYDEVLSVLSSDGDNPTTVGTKIVDILNMSNGKRFAAPFSMVDVATAKKVADAMKILALDIAATKPFRPRHSTLSPLQKAMHDVFDGACTHDPSLLDLGRLGRGFAALEVKPALNGVESSVLERVRTAGTQLSQIVKDEFVLCRHVGHEDTGASIFCPMHHGSVPVVETAVTEKIDAYRNLSFNTHTMWKHVVNLALDAQ